MVKNISILFLLLLMLNLFAFVDYIRVNESYPELIRYKAKYQECLRGK